MKESVCPARQRWCIFIYIFSFNSSSSLCRLVRGILGRVEGINDSPLLSREKALGGSLYLDKFTTLLQDAGGLVGALELSSPCGPLFSREEALGGEACIWIN